MVFYKFIKIIIIVLRLAKLKIDLVVQNNGALDLIKINRDSFSILKFLSSIYYFVKINQAISTIFFLHIDI